MTDLEFIRQLLDGTATTAEARNLTPEQRTYARYHADTAHEKAPASASTRQGSPTTALSGSRRGQV